MMSGIQKEFEGWCEEQEGARLKNEERKVGNYNSLIHRPTDPSSIEHKSKCVLEDGTEIEVSHFEAQNNDMDRFTVSLANKGIGWQTFYKGKGSARGNEFRGSEEVIRLDDPEPESLEKTSDLIETSDDSLKFMGTDGTFGIREWK